MRDLYLSDLKRILKDKLFMVTCIIAGALAVVNPLLNKLLFEALNIGDLLGDMMSAKSMTLSSFAPGDNLGLIMPILIAIIVSKDFSHGTVRNKIISGRSRSSIFISHLLSSATVMCALITLHALLTLGVSLCFFPYQAGGFAFSDLGYLLLSFFFEMIVYVAVSAIVTLIATASKNMGICILLYLAVSIGMSLIGTIFQVAGAFLDPSTIASKVVEFINAFNIYTSSLIGSGVSYPLKDIIYIVLPPLIIGAGATLLGLKTFKRKNLK